VTTKMRSLDRAARESSDDQVSWGPQRQEATEFTVARHSLFLEEVMPKWYSTLMLRPNLASPM